MHCLLALRAGLRAARGDLVFFSDADLQFDLGEIHNLLVHAEEFEIVAGYRAFRYGEEVEVIEGKVKKARGKNSRNRNLFESIAGSDSDDLLQGGMRFLEDIS